MCDRNQNVRLFSAEWKLCNINFRISLGATNWNTTSPLLSFHLLYRTSFFTSWFFLFIPERFHNRIYLRYFLQNLFSNMKRLFAFDLTHHDRKSALNPPVVYSTDCSKAVVPVLVLLFVALWFILRGNLFYVLPCVILFFCFSILLALRLPRLGERANLSAFRTFVRFVLVWICRFPLPLGVWEGGTPWTFLLPFFIQGASSICYPKFHRVYVR